MRADLFSLLSTSFLFSHPLVLEPHLTLCFLFLGRRSFQCGAPGDLLIPGSILDFGDMLTGP